MTMFRFLLLSLMPTTVVLSVPIPRSISNDAIDTLSDGLHAFDYALRQLSHSAAVSELDAPVSAVVHLVKYNFTTNTDKHAPFRLLVASVCELVS